MNTTITPSNTQVRHHVQQTRKQILPPPKIFLQETCAKHQYIRSKDFSGVYERPERLRAAYLGISAAYARLESVYSSSSRREPFKIIKSAASVKFDHLAVSYVHGQDNGAYLRNLSHWAQESKHRIAKGVLEIPDSLKELEDDLYLCPESVEAFQGGLGTVCEAVDAVISADEHSSRRAFAVIRPPGHHCGEDSPNGFCFVNGVAVGAAHGKCIERIFRFNMMTTSAIAYIDHAVRRAVIFDIDLHHGNGTQEIATQINSESWRDRHEQDGLQIFYGSIHDIASFPCEGNKPDMVADASKCTSGQDGQWIENIHLKPYIEDSEFWNDYDSRYRKLMTKAAEFIQKTGGTRKDDVIVLMSCGFDASEHESPAMNRHGCKVPTGFYHRFTRDVCQFAETYASGRLVSVMEGGYDDRALISGAMAHVCGLVDSGKGEVDPRWWDAYNIQQLETQLRKRKGRRPHATHLEQWLQRTLQISPLLGGMPTKSHKIDIPAFHPPEPSGSVSASSSVEPVQPRKRGRPRKHLLPASAPLTAPPPTGGSVSGTKRSHTDDTGSASKQPRSSSYVSSTSTGSSYASTSFLAFPYASVSVTVDPTLSLRWQPPNAHIPYLSGQPVAPPPLLLDSTPMQPTMMQFRIPMELPTPPRSRTSETTMKRSQNTQHATVVDLNRFWPRGQLTPSDISAASGSAYRCHTRFEPHLSAWGVRSVKNIDQHFCYVPNRYKNALRFLNYRIAQLVLAAETSFHPPRSAASEHQRHQIRDLRDSVQRSLIFHHLVRESVFKDIRDRCYAGRDPSTARPSGPMTMRLPTLDTWLLHQYAIGKFGPVHFDTGRLQAMFNDHDPLELDWENWADTAEREMTYGFDFTPSEKDIAMHKEAGIPVNPVVEGVNVRADWYKRVVDEQVKKIRASI